MINFLKYRVLFPVTENYIYLNHASTGPLPITAVKAITQLSQRYAEQGNIEWQECEKLTNETRELAARMLKVNSAEIGFIQNTSQGIIFALGSIPFKKGDNVILMKDAFPTNHYPFLYLLPDIEKRYVTSSELLEDPNFIQKQIDKNTRAIALDWVNFLSGIAIDIATIGQICRKQGIYFIVDGMQGLGALSLDLSKVAVDFFATGAPKWLLGPHGIGLFYVRREILSNLKLFNIGWLSADWVDFYDIFTPKQLKTSAARFEAGTKNYLGIVGLKESLKLLTEIGLANIEARIHRLGDYLVSKLNDTNFKLITPKAKEKRAGIITFRRKDKVSKDLFMALKQKKVIISLREDYLRISPHFYNTLEELDLLLKIIL